MEIRQVYSLIAINQQTGRTHTQHNIDALRVLGRMQVHAVHGQLLGILQVVELGLCGRLTPECENRNQRLDMDLVIDSWPNSLVGLVQIHDLVLELCCLIGCDFEVLQIGTGWHFLGIIVAHLGLHQVRAEQGVRDKGAGQTALQDVVAHLQAQMVARDVLLELRRLRWIELDGECQWPGIRAKEFRDGLLQIQPNTRIGGRLIGQAKVVLLNDVQTGANGVDQVAAFGFALHN